MCEALLAIELLRATDQSGGQKSIHLTQAAESLRRALAELRAASPQTAGIPTLGFVVGTTAQWSCATGAGGHSRPLRTA
jgi:hypothetical protein